MKNKVLWSPSEKSIKSTNLSNFIQFLSNDKHFILDTTLSPESQYKQLYNWSISFPEDFWSSFFTFSNIKYSGNIKSICDNINN